MKKGVKVNKRLKVFLIILGIAVVITILALIGSNPKDNSMNDNSDESTILPPATNPEIKEGAVLYEPKYTFYNFTDPKENAFSVQIPGGWTLSEDSGLIRPYIDAGIKLMVMSPKNQQFIFLSPFAIYTTPNDLLTFAGFPEGSYYDPSGGFSTPMLVKRYTEADDFLKEIVQGLSIETEIVETIERPDLIVENPGPLVTQQSAAEITYTSNFGADPTTNKIIAYIYLIEPSGMGIWMVSIFGYSSPESLFNETEYLVLKSAETFRVNPSWAAKEAQEVNKRAGIISSTQDSISETIASSFEYRSQSQDRINNEWSKTILGVEEVYNSETGDTRFVDSGAEYYWMDNQNRVWGTDTDENPFPLEDMTKLEIKKG
jgi:hypothetical protein